MNTDSVQLLLVAGGMGVRLGTSEPKALVTIGGTPLFVHTLRPFHALGLLSEAVVVAPEAHVSVFQDLVDHEFDASSITVIPGGRERQDSVNAGLNHLSPSTKIVVIHDAARPFVTESIISNAINAAQKSGAATVAVPCTDTILVATEENLLANTPDRKDLWACQTPQVFSVAVIKEALRKASAEGYLGTDDASLVNRTGGNVQLVRGSPHNIKITTPEDLEYAEYLLTKEKK